METVKEHDLCFVDLDSSCQGPMLTYCGENVTLGYIDLCALPICLRNKCVECRVLDDEPKNTSDHLPLVIELNTDLETLIDGRRNPSNSPTSWERVNKLGAEHVYTKPLEDSIGIYIATEYPQIAPRLWSTGQVDGVYNSLVSIIISVDSSCPSGNIQKSCKHFWTSTLTEAARNKKNAWRAWVNSGWPRDRVNTEWLRYKKCKRALRREMRNMKGWPKNSLLMS